MKLNVKALANASAVVVGSVYVVCALVVALLPELSMQIADSWFHGFKISNLGPGTVTIESLILGLVTSVVGTWVMGYVFAVVYNSFSGKK